MEAMLDFIKNNYIMFIVVSIVLIFALIGYMVDNKYNKDVEIKHNRKNKVIK